MPYPNCDGCVASRSDCRVRIHWDRHAGAGRSGAAVARAMSRSLKRPTSLTYEASRLAVHGAHASGVRSAARLENR